MFYRDLKETLDSGLTKLVGDDKAAQLIDEMEHKLIDPYDEPEPLEEKAMEQGLRVEIINVHPGDFGGYGGARRDFGFIVTGGTWAVKDQLKKFGLRWDKKQNGWSMMSGFSEYTMKSWGPPEKKVKAVLAKVKDFVKTYNDEIEKRNAEKLAGAGVKEEPFKTMTAREKTKYISSIFRANSRLKQYGIQIVHDFPSGVLGGAMGSPNIYVVGNTYPIKDLLKKFGFRFEKQVPGSVVEHLRKMGVKMKGRAGWMMDGATYDRIQKQVQHGIIKKLEMGEDVDLEDVEVIDEEELFEKVKRDWYYDEKDGVWRKEGVKFEGILRDRGKYWEWMVSSIKGTHYSTEGKAQDKKSAMKEADMGAVKLFKEMKAEREHSKKTKSEPKKSSSMKGAAWESDEDGDDLEEIIARVNNPDVLDYIKKKGQATAMMVAQAFATGDKDMTRRLDDLVKGGKLKKDGYKYSISEEAELDEAVKRGSAGGKPAREYAIVSRDTGKPAAFVKANTATAAFAWAVSNKYIDEGAYVLFNPSKNLDGTSAYGEWYKPIAAHSKGGQVRFERVESGDIKLAPKGYRKTDMKEDILDTRMKVLQEAMAVGVTTYDVKPPPGMPAAKPEKAPPRKKAPSEPKAQPRRVKQPETEEEAWEQHKEAEEYLTKNATKHPKKSAWWVPPHNLMINEALMGMNLWKFGYRLGVRRHGKPQWGGGKTEGEINGITVQPRWYPVHDRDIGAMHMSGFRSINTDIAKKLISLAKKQGKIDDDVKKLLGRAESEFKIKIPDKIKNKLIKDAVKVAKRRWAAKGSAPNMLHPFDGSKPRKLGVWEDEEPEDGFEIAEDGGLEEIGPDLEMSEGSEDIMADLEIEATWPTMSDEELDEMIGPIDEEPIDEEPIDEEPNEPTDRQTDGE